MGSKIKLFIHLLTIGFLFSCGKPEIERDKPEIECNKPEIECDTILNDGIHVKYNIPYNTLNSNTLDMYYKPDESKKSVIIFAFGGGWVSGSKSDWQENHIYFFNNLNFISISVDYTLSNNNINAKHPVMVNDIAQSVRWVYDNIEQYGGDKNKIYLIGASAGSLLVDLVATDERILNRVELPLTTIKGVISIDGGAYLTLDPLEYILPEQNSPLYPNLKDLKRIYQSVFGLTIEENRDSCPYNHISKDKNIPPFLLISQGSDILYRFKPNNMMRIKLQQNGISASHHIAQGYDHTQIYTCIGTPQDTIGIGNSIISFIKSTYNHE